MNPSLARRISVETRIGELSKFGTLASRVIAARAAGFVARSGLGCSTHVTNCWDDNDADRTGNFRTVPVFLLQLRL